MKTGNVDQDDDFLCALPDSLEYNHLRFISETAFQVIKKRPPYAFTVCCRTFAYHLAIVYLSIVKNTTDKAAHFYF